MEEITVVDPQSWVDATVSGLMSPVGGFIGFVVVALLAIGLINALARLRKAKNNT